MPGPQEVDDIGNNIAQPDLQRPEAIELRSPGPRFLVGLIYSEIIDLPGNNPVTIEDGQLKIDRERLEDERQRVKKALSDSIGNGDEQVFLKMTGGLESSDIEELADLAQKLKQAFDARTRNPFELQSINVDLLTDGIAERNLIREGLKPQIARQPFIFKDRGGNVLGDDDLDFVFAKKKEEGYKILVASKKGIDQIDVPFELNDDKFKPELTRVDKDLVNNSIIIPLSDAADGTKPLVAVFEILKGPLNLVDVLKKQESIDQKKQKPSEPGSASVRLPITSTPNYNPPALRTPRRSSEGGGYGYARSSG